MSSGLSREACLGSRGFARTDKETALIRRSRLFCCVVASTSQMCWSLCLEPS